MVCLQRMDLALNIVPTVAIALLLVASGGMCGGCDRTAGCGWAYCPASRGVSCCVVFTFFASVCGTVAVLLMTVWIGSSRAIVYVRVVMQPRCVW